MIDVLDLMLRDMAVVGLGIIGLLCTTVVSYFAAKVVKSVFDYYNEQFAKEKESKYYMMHDPDFSIRLELIEKRKRAGFGKW